MAIGDHDCNCIYCPDKATPMAKQSELRDSFYDGRRSRQEEIDLLKSKINNLKGDIFALGGPLNQIRHMKSDEYTKWNLWHKANEFFQELPKRLHYPELMEIFTRDRGTL